MSYVETPAGAIVTLDLAADGHCRAANIERRHTVTMGGHPRPDHLTRDVITPADLAVILPSQAELLLSVQRLTQERDAIAAERDDLAAAVTRLEARLAAATDAAGVPVLTAVQIRLGLLAAGIMPTAVDAAIAAIPDPVERSQAQAYWEYSTTYHRNHPLIAQLGSALGLSSDAIDALWQASASL